MRRYEDRLPKSYSEGMRRLNGRRSYVAANNTRVQEMNSRIEVLFHGNLIAMFWPDGTAWFSTQGYSSSSTNVRLNAMAPPGVAYMIRSREAKLVITGRDIPEAYTASEVDLRIHPNGRREIVARRKED